MRRMGVVVAAALLASVLVGCGEDEVCSRPDGAGCYPAPDPSGDDEPNEADEDFVLERALSISQLDDLAELAAETSDDSTLTELAEAYGEESDDLLDALDGWEEEWDLDPIVYDSAVGTSTSVTAPQYSGDDDYATLLDLSGDEFDAYWIEVMLDRADDQIAVTEDLLDEGSHPGLRSAAQRWIDANEVLQVSLEDLDRDDDR